VPVQGQATAAVDAMPRLDAMPRPAEDFVVIHATAEMNAEAAKLLTNADYAWFDRAPARDIKATLERAFLETFGALQGDITITEHFPEPYMVRFIYPHHRANAVARHDFLFEGLKVQVRPWRLEDNAEQVNMRHHVRLCVENVPMYSWYAKEAQ
jgi:phage terminase large subunit-like protein